MTDSAQGGGQKGGGQGGGMPSWVGGLISAMVGGKLSEISNKLSGQYRELGQENREPIEAMSRDMIAWAEGDWENFKKRYRPVSQALATDAMEGPDHDSAQGVVSADVAQQVKAANTAVGGMRRGINPASGSSRSALLEVAGKQGSAEGAGFGIARRGEDNEVFSKRMNVVNTHKGIPTSSAALGGKAMDMRNLGARRYLKLSDSYSGAADSAASTAAGGIGRVAGYWANRGNGSNDQDWGDLGGADWGGEGWNNPRSGGAQGSDDPGYSDLYAEGGLIRGPGTGRSDSIPATIDDSVPARVSNGEYRIPARTVRYYGQKFFDDLQARYGTKRK